MSDKFGVNTWWTVPETVKDGEAVLNILENCGFEKTDIRLPSRRTVVSRAINSFRDRRSKDNRRVTEVAGDNGLYVTFGILEQEQVDEETVVFKQRTTVRLNKDTGSVNAEGELADEVMNAIHRFEGKITDDDIRSFLRKVIRMCWGVPKRPTGGIYFVPGRFADIVQSAQNVLDQIGSGAKLYVEGIMDGPREREIVVESVTSNIESQIQKAIADAERIEKSTKSVKSQELKLDGLREMVKVYRDLLGHEVKFESISESLAEAERMIGEKLSVMQEDANKAPAAVPSIITKNTETSSVSKRIIHRTNNDQFIRLAVEVLKEAGTDGMHYREITKAAIDRGLSTSGKTPEQTMNARLSVAVKNGDNQFHRVSRGVYTVV